MKPKDPYKVLGVKKDTTAEEVKKRYRAVAMKNHPDRNPGDGKAADRYRAATEAYEVLSDPARREHYDRTGEVRPVASRKRQEILTVLQPCMAEAIQYAKAAHGGVKAKDIVDLMRKILEGQLSQAKQSYKSVFDQQKVLEDAAGRFTCPAGEDNLLAEMAKSGARECEAAAAEQKKRVDLLEECMAFLKTYGYTVTKELGKVEFKPDWGATSTGKWRTIT